MLTSIVHVAAAILPQGIVGLIMGILSQFVPQMITKPRYSIAIGSILIIVAEILQVYSYGGQGYDYWRYCFPAFVLGSAGAMICYFGSAINVIAYAPPEMSGVMGAWTQVCLPLPFDAWIAPLTPGGCRSSRRCYHSGCYGSV